MKTLFAILLIATPAFATVSVKRSAEKPKTVDVRIVDEPLSSAAKAIGIYLPHPVQIVLSDEPNVTFSAKHVSPEAALKAIATAANAKLTVEQDQYWIRNDRDASITLDVKDQDVHTILKSMQKQCGIKNLVIDPGVQGSGTFIFDKVPCRTAFDVVLRTMGLTTFDYGDSVVSVGTSTRH